MSYRLGLAVVTATFLTCSVNYSFALSKSEYIEKTQNMILGGRKSGNKLLRLRLDLTSDNIDIIKFKQECLLLKNEFLDYRMSWLSTSTDFVDEISKYTYATTPDWMNVGFSIDSLMRVYLSEMHAYAVLTCSASTVLDLNYAISDEVHQNLASLALVGLDEYRVRLYK